MNKMSVKLSFLMIFVIIVAMSSCGLLGGNKGDQGELLGAP